MRRRTDAGKGAGLQSIYAMWQMLEEAGKCEPVRLAGHLKIANSDGFYRVKNLLTDTINMINSLRPPKNILAKDALCRVGQILWPKNLLLVQSLVWTKKSASGLISYQLSDNELMSL